MATPDLPVPESRGSDRDCARCSEKAIVGSDKVQVMSTVTAMQSAGPDKPMVPVASYPPLHGTQERGTHSSGAGTENTEGWATRPARKNPSESRTSSSRLGLSGPPAIGTIAAVAESPVMTRFSTGRPTMYAV